MKPLHLLTALVLTLAVGCGNAVTSDVSSTAASTHNERYFMALYGYQGQGRLNLPRRSHTWAVFAKFDGRQLAVANVNQFAISWLAADADVGMFQGVERGYNFSHAQTMAIASRMPVTVQRTAFVEIDASLYNSAVSRYWTLTHGAASGTVNYKMIDDMSGRSQVLSGRAGGYTNCIHGVSDLAATEAGLLDTGTLRGFDASLAVFNWLGRTGHVLSRGQDDGVVARRLGL